jgi:transposase
MKGMSSSQPPISAEQMAALPPEFRALLQAVIDHYEARIAVLEARIVELERQLPKTPQNSSLPPSTQHPHAKPLPKKPRSKRNRGGQPGHPRHERALIPVEQCCESFDHLPRQCRGCGGKLSGSDPAPLRHQVWELPEIKPLVSEHRLHRLSCPGCGKTTCGQLPAGVPQGQAGPRLIGFVALLMGSFRQSKRKTALFLTQILGTPCSPGWVVKLQNQATAALRPDYDHLVAQLPKQGNLNIDESPNKQGPLKTWLWVFVAQRFTVFGLRLSRAAEELYAHVGEQFAGTVGCDRAKMYCRLKRVQWCWAHLIRDFQALVDSGDGQAKRLGHDLLREVKAMFALWDRVRDGTLSRRGFKSQITPIRGAVEGLLLRGVFSGNGRLTGMCDALWRDRENLWTFIEVEGVEPTNNQAERALRHAVIWRKLSFGTQSPAGSRFLETMLTVIETCRQQEKNAFDYITQAVHAHITGQKPRPLLNGA